MSALGQKPTYAVQKAMSALPPIATAKANSRKSDLPPKAHMCGATRDLRYGPKADIHRVLRLITSSEDRLASRRDAIDIAGPVVTSWHQPLACASYRQRKNQIAKQALIEIGPDKIEMVPPGGCVTGNSCLES